jgi:putative transcriptional regulator
MKMTVNNRFAILLAEKRVKERRNISLQEVAEKTGVSRRALYAWENNRVNRFDVPVINALCEYFGIEPGALFQYVPDEKQESEKPTKPRKVKKSA